MGHKILLADDSITVQKIVKLTFSDEGIEVIAVGNGELAVQKLQEMRPDLVMADVFMPGKDGYEVCEYVKTHPDLRHTPVILLVHAFEPFDQEHALRVGADQHLTKPFQSIRALVATVKDIIALPASQAAYSAAASAAQTQTPEPSALPLHAEPSSALPYTEAAFAAVDPTPAFTAANLGLNFPTVDSAPALPTFAPSVPALADADAGFAPVEAEPMLPAFSQVDVGEGFTSVDTAPLAFPTQAEQDSGEAVTQAMNDAPLTPEMESFLPPLTLESAVTTEPEMTAPLETESHLSTAETEEPLSFDPASAFNLNFSDEPVQMPPVDHQADTAPLACTAEMEALNEVLDLDNELPSAPLQSDELDLLPEIASMLPVAPEVTAAAEQPVGEPTINELTTCEQFNEAATATGFPAMSSVISPTISDDALPILAEVEMPIEMPRATFQPEAEVAAHTVSTEDMDPLSLEIPEPGAAFESVFTSVTNALNGHGTDSETGQIIEAQPAAIEPPAAKQDTSAGIESAPAQGFSLDNIPSALIDEIARRVVERLSEKAIQEIAWEVVPEMAELLIRKQLAEKVPR